MNARYINEWSEGWSDHIEGLMNPKKFGGNYRDNLIVDIAAVGVKFNRNSYLMSLGGKINVYKRLIIVKEYITHRKA